MTVGSLVGASLGAVGNLVGRAVLEQIKPQFSYVSEPRIHEEPVTGFSLRSLVPIKFSLPMPLMIHIPLFDQVIRAAPSSRVHENRKLTQSSVKA